MNEQANSFYKNIAAFCSFLENESVTPEDVFFIPEDYPDTTNKQYFGITTASGAESVKAGIYYYSVRTETRRGKRLQVRIFGQRDGLTQPAARPHISFKLPSVYKRGRQGERRDTLHFNGFFSKKKRAKN